MNVGGMVQKLRTISKVSNIEAIHVLINTSGERRKDTKEGNGKSIMLAL